MHSRIAVTMGDPAGIGPELCLRLIDTPLDRGVRLVIVGSGSVLRAVAERLGIADAMAAIPIVGSADPASVTAAWSTSGTVPLIVDLGPDAERVRAGAVDAETGRASFEYVERAIELALGGVVDAVVTGPIHKEAWHAAGVPYPGHTELFSERTGAQRTCMMLTSEAITCSLVTTHIGLADVARAIDSERIRTVIELTGHAMQRLRGRPPRLGVCGLNPHAGEHGLFGYGEEERVIEPALAAARTAGWNVEGPLSADTAFTPDQRRRFDAYVCMYHDQGLIPLKTLAFDEAVNVTLGLPIVRTSVDHGPALDIAWQGRARAESLFQAVKLAARLCGRSA